MANAPEDIISDGEKNTTSVSASIQSDSQSKEITFARGGNEHFYAPNEKYEGFHRYDPNFQWSEQEEKQLIRRVRFTVS